MSWSTPTHQANKKTPTRKWVGKAEIYSHHKPHPWHSDIQLRRNAQLPASLWGIRVWTKHLAPPLLELGLPPEGWPPKYLALRASEVCVHKTHQTIVNKEIGFFCFCFWPRHAACGILVPQSRIGPAPPALEVQSLNHWTTREVPKEIVLKWHLWKYFGCYQSCIERKYHTFKYFYS